MNSEKHLLRREILFHPKDTEAIRVNIASKSNLYFSNSMPRSASYPYIKIFLSFECILTTFVIHLIIISMTKEDFGSLFKAIDDMNTQEFVSYLNDDALLRFGNQSVVEGKSAIFEYIDAFFKAIKAIAHSELEVWELSDVSFVNGRGTYTRHDDTQLSVVFSNTFKMKDNLIQEYLIYVDNSELF